MHLSLEQRAFRGAGESRSCPQCSERPSLVTLASVLCYGYQVLLVELPVVPINVGKVN